MDCNVKKEMQLFIAEAEGVLQHVVQSFNWVETENVQTTETKFSYCPIMKEHRVPEDKMKEHIEKCQLKSLGYSLDDVFLEPIEPHLAAHPSVVKIDKYKQQEVLCQALKRNRNLNISTRLREPPLTFDRYLYEFTADERYVLYDYAIQQTSSQHNSQRQLADSLVMGRDAVSSDKLGRDGGAPQTLKDLLAAERDAKRRRQAYRKKNPDAGGKKSSTETLRELIQSQMEFFYSSKQDGGLDSNEKPVEPAVQWRYGVRLNVHNYHRQWEVAGGTSERKHARDDDSSTSGGFREKGQEIIRNPRTSIDSSSRRSRGKTGEYFSENEGQTQREHSGRFQSHRGENVFERGGETQRRDRDRSDRRPDKKSDRPNRNASISPHSSRHHKKQYRRSRSRSPRKHKSDHRNRRSSSKHDKRSHRKHANDEPARCSTSRSRSRENSRPGRKTYERTGSARADSKPSRGKYSERDENRDGRHSRSFSVAAPTEGDRSRYHTAREMHTAAAHEITSVSADFYENSRDIKPSLASLNVDIHPHMSEDNHITIKKEPASPGEMERREYLELKRKLLPLSPNRKTSSSSTSSDERGHESYYTMHKKKKSKRKKRKRLRHEK